MATLTLLRSCRGKASVFLLRPGMVDMTKKSLALSSPALNMFKARRGPFTPDELAAYTWKCGSLHFIIIYVVGIVEKAGSGHVMTAATHWTVERVVTLGLVGILPAALFVQGPAMDYALATAVVLHGHWGLHGVATDYVAKFFPPINMMATTLSVLALGGLYYFNYNDVGVCKAIQMVWGL